MWVGKSAYLAADPWQSKGGQQAIAHAITDCWVRARGLGHPHVNPLAQQPFRFDCLRGSPIKDASGDGSSDCQPSPYLPPRGQDHNRHSRDQRPPSPQFPSPSPDRGFESDQSSISTASLMSSRSDRSDGSWHPQWGRQHQEDGACMKINLPVFKDKDAMDTMTYQSWRWDLMVYQHVGCSDCTLLPYAIRSLQDYPGKLVQSSSKDITLYDVLTILDEHYNNVKALDALSQELSQLWMADKETVLDRGICLLRHFRFSCFLPWSISPWSSGRVKERPLLWQTSQVTESDGCLSKGGSAGKNLLRLPKGHPRGQKRRLYWVALKPQNSNDW